MLQFSYVVAKLTMVQGL